MSADKKGLAVLLMAVATVLAGLDAVIVRSLAGQVHPLMIGFFRAVFGLIAVLPWMVLRVDLRASPYRGMHVLRAGLKLASLVALFVAYAHAPLADATALNFTMPIFLTLGAWIFLREPVLAGRVLAVLVGFAGIAIIIRPGASGFDPWLLFALAGAVLTAAIQLILRRMAQRDTTDRLVAWNLLSMVPLGLLAALPVWVTPTPDQIALLALQGVLGAVNMTLITRAFAMADASFLAPLDFLRLPVVAILAYLFFGEIALASTWIGGAVIFASVLLVAGNGRWRQSRSRGHDD
ncbi:DMT family transporter [Paracoccus shanxieyensis]|uniref:EamA family transporter n=1 Tax=Paracoccus shanxieyensis TaxID=2675752 RepID=A0A6L6J454_9RHOB|nr:DMT family transporter [Paracoccus shanxieyensis]MTH66182.1 EamA family transporter [Paracoccus shanxieyensis]MTH89469.1 EamA family transporter [Paracoccus shanxieyensis]